MKLGIIGLPGSGKATIFEALTQNVAAGPKGETRIGTVRVPDKRLDVLNEMHKREKLIYAQVEYLLPGMPEHKRERGTDQLIWTQVRDCDALIHTIRNFKVYGFEDPKPYADFHELDQELILADLVVIEKRLERLELDKKRGKKTDAEEISLLNDCLKNLENEIPLRKFSDLASAQNLRGYAFLSAKPMLVLFNNEDDDDTLPEVEEVTSRENCLIIRGKLEQELAQMSEQEASEFLTEFNITASAMDRVIKRSYELLGLIAFFTIGDKEVRAWTVKQGTCAIDAAEVIHTDMKKGFIRAEVLSYEDLMSAGSYQAARKKGTVRLEGKTYQINDGDIVYIRFNV
ncbi:MAG: redox-regulated ATPase YchF [Deltaproteobacteria bacterium]|nr:MAG: redox-regulated ATPase YchF [Deltaproteobacteria bacterium]